MQGVKKRKIVTTLQKEKNITMEGKDQKVIKEMKSVGWERELFMYIVTVHVVIQWCLCLLGTYLVCMINGEFLDHATDFIFL